MRLFLLGFLAAALTAQTWQSMTELPGVDLTALPPPQKSAVLKMLREQDCNCGCGLKIAECRAKDPQCSYSRSLANGVVREFQAGKSVDQVYTRLRQLQEQGALKPKVLEDPVPLHLDGAPSLGPANAAVTLVEFSDFQCPYCSLAAPKAVALVKAYPGKLRLVFKQFPLDMHSAANLAAQAALAANAQGRFWELHDRLFANFRTLSRENIVAWASESGLNVLKFQMDLTNGTYAAAVRKDQAEGEAAGVMGTPTFFLNGKRYNGPFEPETLKPLIDAELKAAAR